MHTPRTLLLALLGFTLPAVAQTDQQRRQNEEYKRLSQATSRAFAVPPSTYRAPAATPSAAPSTSSSNTSSSATYRGSSSAYAGSTGGTYSAYAQSFARKQQQAEANEKYDAELRKRREQARIQQQAAQQAAAQQYAANQLIERQQAEAEYQRNLAEQAAWEKATMHDPYATLEPLDPTKFTNAQLYKDYKRRADGGHRFYNADPKAALQAARLAWDGLGTPTGQRNASEATTYYLKALDCGLKFCIGGEILEASASQNPDYINAAVIAYKNSITYTDTLYRSRAYANLYRLFSTQAVPIGPSIIDGNWATEVYLWARNRYLPGADDALANLMNSRLEQLPLYESSTLAQLSQVYNLADPNLASPALLLWSYLGDAYEREGTPITTSPYAKVFETTHGLPELRTLMMAKLHAELVSGLSPTGLSTTQIAACAAAFSTYQSTINNAFANGYHIKTSDALVLFNFYNSANPKAQNPANALRYATILAQNGEHALLTKAALAHRYGRYGWPQNNKTAFDILNTSAQQWPQNSAEQKEAKAAKLVEMAKYFAADTLATLAAAPKYATPFLQQSAELSSTHFNDFMTHLMIHNQDAAPTAYLRTWLQKGIDYNTAQIAHAKATNGDPFIPETYLSIIQGHLRQMDAKPK